MPNHTDEQYDKQRRMKNAYAEENMKINQKLDKARTDLLESEKIRLRLEAELAAERGNLKMVLDNNNHRYRSFEDEVLRLRKLLEENGVEIGG
jgi:hypothetical protein